MATFKLSGSERRAVTGARETGKAEPSERLEVTMLLRRRTDAALKQHLRRLAAGDRSRPHFERDEFARQFGADPKDIARIRKFATRHGFAVVMEHQARRTVMLSGTVELFNRAFGITLKRCEHESGSYRGRTGPLHLPAELRNVVHAVLGLDNRPQAQPHFRRRRDGTGLQPLAARTSFTPPQLAALYGFPDSTARNQCVGIIELGGGYRPSDLETYFKNLGIAPPRVTAISVDHANNSPSGNPNGPDGEVMLDIEVAGALAPAAEIAVYFAPNTDAGFLNAVTTALHDTAHQPSVISISWGAAESRWTKQAMKAMDDAFQSAAAMGVSICVASGDNGSSDGVADGTDHVDFPASSPHVLGCGGTHLQATDGHISNETVWNDGAAGGAGGGGISDMFALPAWQNGLQVSNSGGEHALKKRGVPDVCGDADPESGYDVRVDGANTVIGGTSAVAPLWAGLIARINAMKGNTVGYLNPVLYRHADDLHDITQGNNGDFSATPGWDACTGLGSPSGMSLLNSIDVPPRTPVSPKVSAKRKTRPSRRNHHR